MRRCASMRWRARSNARAGTRPSSWPASRRAADLWKHTDYKPKDVDTVQLYDGFSFQAILWLEALGFCGTGEGGRFIEGGERIAINGELPLNTGGGQLGAGRLHGFGLCARSGRAVARRRRGAADCGRPARRRLRVRRRPARDRPVVGEGLSVTAEAIPLDQLPGFRRRFRITPRAGSVCSELEDDYHRMSVTLTHDGRTVTDVEPVMERVPWTICPGARVQLAADLHRRRARGRRGARRETRELHTLARSRGAGRCACHG